MFLVSQSWRMDTVSHLYFLLIICHGLLTAWYSFCSGHDGWRNSAPSTMVGWRTIASGAMGGEASRLAGWGISRLQGVCIFLPVAMAPWPHRVYSGHVGWRNTASGTMVGDIPRLAPWYVPSCGVQGFFSPWDHRLLPTRLAVKR